MAVTFVRTFRAHYNVRPGLYNIYPGLPEYYPVVIYV